jgi:alanine dehydrogenase
VQHFQFDLSSGHQVALFNAQDITSLLDMPVCVDRVEDAFRRLGEGTAPSPGVLSFDGGGGHFHIKAGLSGAGHFVTKVNGNYPGNPAIGLPTIQGLVMLCDAGDGRPLAVLDSAELTARRTGAATGVAVKHLAIEKPLVVTLCGCGRQAASQLAAVAAVRPIERVDVCDIDDDRAARFARQQSHDIPVAAFPLSRLREYTRSSDVVITCTPSRRALLRRDDVRNGCLVAAVGADNPQKQEIDPALMAHSKVITDLTGQCAVMGDLQHAIAARLMTKEGVYAELGEVVAGVKPGRADAEEIIVFDSTGFGLLDAVTAALVYERSCL